MKFLVILFSIAVMMYAIVKHRLPGNRKFLIIAYWKSLTPKGVAIYTVGLVILIITVFF